MATVTKRGTKWQVKIRKKGYEPQSNTFTTKVAADRWARQVETEMDKGVFVSTSKAENTTLHDLMERYQKEVLPSKKSQRQVQSHCNVIDGLIGTKTAASLTPAVLAQFRDERMKTVTGHTVRKDLLLIRRILSQAQREWEIYLPMGNPVDSITIPKQPKGRDRRLTTGEEEKLLQQATEYGGEIHNIIIVALETGMRRGEINRLRWKHIQLKSKTAQLFDTKNEEDRTVPLSNTVGEMLKKLPHNISGKVFALNPDSITQAFERICKKAGIEDLRFHDLRHEATTRLFEKGLSIMEVSAITGHKDLAMLRKYTHLRAEDLAKKLG